MKPAGSTRDWLWAAAGALAIVAAMAALFRAPQAPVPVNRTGGVAVRLDAEQALREEAAIFDPAPLFLPTRLNAAPKGVELREPGASFPDYLPKLGFAELTLKLDSLSLPKPVNVPPPAATAPGAVLALPAPGALALGMGRTDAPVPSLESRGGFVEIIAARDGRRVFANPLVDSARPPGGKPWQPLEFVAAVDAAGLVGPLVPMARSGVEEVDNFFQNYLARSLRVGERLPPGFYRICVGP
jgi:hypothetical protein